MANNYFGNSHIPDFNDIQANSLKLISNYKINQDLETNDTVKFAELDTLHLIESNGSCVLLGNHRGYNLSSNNSNNVLIGSNPDSISDNLTTGTQNIIIGSGCNAFGSDVIYSIGIGCLDDPVKTTEIMIGNSHITKANIRCANLGIPYANTTDGLYVDGSICSKTSLVIENSSYRNVITQTALTDNRTLTLPNINLSLVSPSFTDITATGTAHLQNTVYSYLDSYIHTTGAPSTKTISTALFSEGIYQYCIHSMIDNNVECFGILRNSHGGLSYITPLITSILYVSSITINDTELSVTFTASLASQSISLTLLKVGV